MRNYADTGDGPIVSLRIFNKALAIGNLIPGGFAL